MILEVQDQGCGLPTQFSTEQLLEKGISSKATSMRGVGLYLVNQLAARYGGSIEMAENDKFGTRMTVYLPKEEQR